MHNLRRRLLDHRQALPTPGPSPPLQTDAPSPGATPPQPRAECSGGDNSDMVDMDLSDEGDANEAGKGSGPGWWGKRGVSGPGRQGMLM